MNPWFGKFVIGGVGTAVLGASLLGATATNVFAAGTTGKPATAAPANDRHADRREIAKAIFESEADVLGMKPEDLRAALKSGKTVEQLAAAKGLTKDQFADRLATSVKPALDKLVDSKKITQAQEDLVLKRIRAGYIPFWNGVHHKKAAA
ncbi:MAG TPA: hypothetical protein VF160_03920 [Candidatus Dormibacteraeota bacterium]